MSAFLRLPLLASGDVVSARRLTIDVARVSGMTTLEQTNLATVVSGLARRTFVSAGRGELVFSTAATGEGRLNLVVEVFDAGTDAGQDTRPDTGPVTWPDTGTVTRPDTGAGAEPDPEAGTNGPQSLKCGGLQLVLDHGTASSGANHVSVTVQLPERTGRDPDLLERLDALRPRVAGSGRGSADLLTRMAEQARELEAMSALVESGRVDRVAADAELALTNRGVVDLVAELSTANESLVASEAEMRQLAGQHSALADLGRRAVASRDLDVLAGRLVRELARVLGIHSVGVLRFAPDKRSLELVANEGCTPGQRTTIGVTQAQSRRLRRSGSRVSDPLVDATDIVFEAPGGVRSSAVVGVQTPAGPWGVLVACDPAEGRFSETAITFIEAAVSLFAFAIARKALEDATRYSASYDALTGLPNRSQLLRDLDAMLIDDPDDLVAHDGSDLAVIFLDIDGFKQVNDTLGHAAGDHVLIEATARLHARARPDDVLARLGGDEFVVLCPGGGPMASVIAQRLLSAFDESFDVEGQDMFLSASAGISLAEAGGTSAQLLADADIAMCRAKLIAGCATVAFHPDMRAEAAAESQLHNELRRAQERGQLRLVYQPIVDLKTGHVRGVEALLRWRHPELGEVAPEVAVAAAERIGIAWDLTCWIAREAAAAVHGWNVANPEHTPLRLALNFTPLLLDGPVRVPELASYVIEAGLPIELVDVEFTETAFTDPSPDALASMAALREMGARLSMDDFGTGYSSLMALADLPLDVLKIDRSFVIPLDGGDSLVSAMTTIARGWDLETIAEGIETDAQLVALVAAGCDSGQGYLFSRPLESEQLAGLAPYEFSFAELVGTAGAAAASAQRLSASPT